MSHAQSRFRLAWLGLAFLFLGLFVKISLELYEDSKVDLLDRQILLMISNLRVAALNGPAVDVTALGSPTVIALFTAVGIVVLWLNRDPGGCAYLALGSSGAGLGALAMKHLFTRARPSVVPRLVEVSGFSYPSGHSLAATTFYLLLMFLSWRHFKRWRARAWLLACTIGLIGAVCLSRLYLGVHYPSDVLGSVFIGSAWACLLTAYFPRKAA